MKLALSLVMALGAGCVDVRADSNGFFGGLGDAIDEVFTTQPSYQSTNYRYAARTMHRSGAPKGRGWTVVTLNGAAVATDSTGLAISHGKDGSLFLSITPQSPLPQSPENLEVSFIFNGEPFLALPARIEGGIVLIDDKTKVPLLVEMLRSKRSYEITSSSFKISGALSGSNRALDEVEQASRMVAIVHSNSQTTDVTINSTVIHEAPEHSAPVAALSEADQKKLEAAADGVANLTAQIELLRKMLQDQQNLAAKSSVEDKTTIVATIGVLNAQIQERTKVQQDEDRKLQGYLTSITPNNRNQYLSARKASEVFPRVPYYIPGTPEIGEFWVEPFVTEKGEQRFKFHFIDRRAANDVKRETIEMNRDELFQVQNGLFKLYSWSEKAQAEKIRRIFSKRAVCFPALECPKDGDQGQLGQTSTEIRFQIYEDGSTAGRIQRNKGRFSEGYNVSIESAMLLQAYAAFVLRESDFDFKQGSQSKEDLDALFQ